MTSKSKLSIVQLRKLITEEVQKSLFEAVNKNKELMDDSLDTQVDKYLSSYEANAKQEKREAFDFRQSMRDFLTEAEEDEDAEGKKESVKNLKLEDINIPIFTNDVMRLVVNYDSLLEIRDTILKRALNYLAKNYNNETTMAFKDELLETHGVVLDKSKQDIDDENFAAPKAGAAGPAGGAG